jgi:adenylate cyclase class 2
LEIEIKFRISDLREIAGRLSALAFYEQTPRTFEQNALYDFPDSRLRRAGEMLRIRHYGDRWTITHKSKGTNQGYKQREELESAVLNGESIGRMLQSLGMRVIFRYEKLRTEWTDGRGHVVLDETPIGDFGELEGEPEWIDEIAAKLGIGRDQYITSSYGELFEHWRRTTGSSAEHMVFSANPGASGASK